MKKFIIILGTIMLGGYMVATLIMADSNSLKSSSKNLVDNANTRINSVILTGN